MDEIREAYFDYWSNQVEAATVFQIQGLAHRLNCTKLLKLTDEYILANFCKVSKTLEFKLMRYSDLRRLIASDDLCVEDEEQVFEAVIVWVKHSVVTRKVVLQHLLKRVRMFSLTIEHLERIAQDEFICSSPLAKEILDEAIWCHTPENQHLNLTFETRPRLKFVLKHHALFFIRQYSSAEYTVETFDLEARKLQLLKRLPEFAYGATVCAMGDVIYIIGEDFVHAFDTKTQTISSISLTNFGRYFACSAVLDNKIYLCGGRTDDDQILNSVESYDPTEKTWKTETSMPTSRHRLNVVPFEGCIYVIGGKNYEGPMQVVESYCSQTKKWITEPPMLYRRYGAGSCECNQRIYVYGGSDKYSILRNGEMFDGLTKQWHIINSMTPRSFGHIVAPCNAEVYVFGGGHKKWKYFNSFRIYDIENHRLRCTVDIDPNQDHEFIGAVFIQSA